MAIEAIVWSQLVSAGNIALIEQPPTATVSVSADLKIQFLPVPHRGEFSDTVAFVIHGPTRSLFYCPDIDSWESGTAMSAP